MRKYIQLSINDTVRGVKSTKIIYLKKVPHGAKLDAIDQQKKYANENEPIRAKSGDIGFSQSAKIGQSEIQNTNNLKISPCEHEEAIVPNIFLRSSTFGVVAKGSRNLQFYSVTPVQLLAHDGSSFVKSGPILDQADFDLWIEILRQSRKLNENGELKFSGTIINFSETLTRIGRSTGGSNVEWLRASIQRLCDTIILVPKYPSYTGHLISPIDTHENSGRIFVEIDPNIENIFRPIAVSKINFTEKNLLRNNQLAQWIYCFFTSYKNQGLKTFDIASLSTLSGSNAVNLTTFRRSLNKALLLINSRLNWSCKIDKEIDCVILSFSSSLIKESAANNTEFNLDVR